MGSSSLLVPQELLFWNEVPGTVLGLPVQNLTESFLTAAPKRGMLLFAFGDMEAEPQRGCDVSQDGRAGSRSGAAGI